MKNFRSNLENWPVIDDSNYNDFLKDDRRKSGLIPRDFIEQPWGSLGFAAPFRQPTIPEVEFKERIEERERTKSRMIDKIRYFKLNPLNQGRTNFCWMNGPTYAAELLRLLQGQKKVRLSPASGACLITGFRNIGGWGAQAVKLIHERGLAPQTLWPANAIDKKYHTKQADAEREKYQFLEWADLEPRHFLQQITNLLLDRPVSATRNRWRHLTCDIDPLIMPNGSIGILTANSGRGRDRDGYTVLSGNWVFADEMLAPGVVTAS